MFACITKEPPITIPKHLAVIPDGNRRYSRRLFMNTVSGYNNSGESLQRLINWSLDKGIRELSIYAWSSENWTRPQNEIDGAMEQFNTALDKWLTDDQKLISFEFISTSVHKLSSTLRTKMHSLKLQTFPSEDTRLKVYIYVSYGFSEDVDRMSTGKYEFDSVIPNAMSEPDLLIRTSGEQRLSNFCMWHLRYTELMFIRPLFPECDEEVWDSCLEEYSTRKRRYGK